MAISKKLLLVLSLTISFISNVHAMDTPSQENKLSLQEKKESYIFHSPREMIDLGQKVFDLALAGQYDQAYTLVPENTVIDFSPTSASDMESYLFYITFGMANYHQDKAKKATLDPNICVDHYTFAAIHLESYISSFGNFTSQIPSVNQRMKDHRALIYGIAGRVYYQLGCLNITPQAHDNEAQEKTILELYIKAKDYYTLALAYSAQMTDPLPKEHMYEIQFALFKLYGCLINVSPLSQKEEYFKSAKEIYKKFKENRRSGALRQFEEAEKYLIGYRKLIEKDEALAKSQAGSKEIRKKRSQRVVALQKDLRETFKRFQDDAEKEQRPLIPKLEINELFDHWIILSKTENAKTISIGLQRLEDRVRQILIDSKKPTHLFNIYQQLEVYLGNEALHHDFKLRMINALLETGNTSQAIERVNILADLEKKRNGTLSLSTRFLKSALKNLVGDHDEWLALEEEMKQASEKVRLARKKKKENRHRKKIEQIRLQQSLSQQKETELQENSSSGLQDQKQKEKDDEHTTVAAAVDYDMPSLSHESLKNAKELKWQRHLEAEKQRAENAKHIENSSLPKTLVSEPVTNVKSEPEDFPLIRDLYQLTNLAKFVDDEIENGTWQFTREELMTYLTSMGCETKEGRRHKKVSLPKAMIIVKDDKVVTVLNDFAGALTLPRWDKSYNNGRVPSYLRIQILEARKKLILLKLRAL